MRTTISTSVSVVLTAICACALSAQEHQHGEAEKFGTVHFATSCAPGVATQFDRSIALLHSFEFGPAVKGFTDVLASDSTCAMAQWGIALARWGNPMVPNLRAPAALEQGRLAARRAAALKDRATPREQSYI